MKLVKNLQPRQIKVRAGIVFFLVILSTPSLHAGYWTLSSSVSYNNSFYVYEEAVQSYYLNAGVRYDNGNWSVSAYLPLTIQSDMFTDDPQNIGVGNTMESGSSYNMGVGDIFLYGEYLFFRAKKVFPALYITTQIKIPTSPEISLYSTGEFDYGLGLTARHWIGSYYGFANINYLKIGNPPGIEYKSPLSLGFGLGTFFLNGKYALNIYYKSYTEIIAGFEPPRQISLGFNYALIPGTIVSIYLIKGLSEGSPNIAYTAGIDFSL